MTGLIAAVALQQLADMEQLQRDWGRRRPATGRSRGRRGGEAIAPALAEGVR